MKKYIYILFGTAAIMACSKEAEISQADKNGISKDGTYTVTVYLDDVTKASINGSTGVFTWDGSEQIAIWDSANSEFVTFGISTYSNDGDKQAKFTTDGAKAGAVFDGNVAYYPASIATVSGSTPTYTFPTSFASLEAASKGFPMQGSLSGGNIHFTHLGCLINLTLNNVPSFTTKLILNDGTNDITVTAGPTDGAINAVVPIPAGTYVLTVKLVDDNSNTFFSKARTSKTYTARNYYTTNAITLGYLLTFTNEARWDAPKVHIWEYGGSNNVDITTDGAHKLYQRPSNVYYTLLDANVESWTAEGNAIGVQFVSTTNALNTTQTDCVYLSRNIDFVIPDGGGMKTDYAVYWDNSSKSFVNVKAYVWSDTGIYVYCTDTTPKVYYWISGDSNSGDWLDKDAERYIFVGTKFYFYKLSSTFQTTITGVEIGFSDWHSGTFSSYDFSAANHFFWYYNKDKTSGEQSPTWDYTTNEFLSSDAWPGDAITITDNLGSFIVPASKYDKPFNFIFSDNGETKSKEWHLTINRDYKLSD